MFIKLNTTANITLANLNILTSNILKNCKTLTSVASIMSLPDVPQAVKDSINVNTSEFVKGAPITAQLTTTSNSDVVDISLPIVNSSRRKEFRWTGITFTYAGLTPPANIAMLANQSYIFSMSDRHIAVIHHNLSFIGMFEFAANDGFYTETSPYLPFGITRNNMSASWTTSFRPLFPGILLNGFTGIAVTSSSSEMGWETPFGYSSLSAPDTNNGYDFVSNNSDKTPILVPFGVQRRDIGAVGGSISELCDFYLGPNNLAGAFETVRVVNEDYICVPVNNSNNMMYVPKW